MSAPGVARRPASLAALLSMLGLSKIDVAEAVDEHATVRAAVTSSETFRWLRRWAVVGVVAIVTPITVLFAYAEDMPELHHVAVPIAIALIVPVWVLELSGVRLPRLVLIAVTVLPNVWLTLIGHTSTNYLWLPLMVAWVGFSGSVIESVVALVFASGTITLSAVLFSISPIYVIEWVFSFMLAWFLGLVLRRQLVVVAQLRLLRGEAEARARQVAVLEERQRLSRELHDSVTQALYGILLYAEAGARALAEGDAAPVADNLREIRDTSQEALGEMRLLLFELRPPLLQEHGLAAALRARLQAVEARSGLATQFWSDVEERLAPNTEQELYRLAQEALNNVLKHAHAARVSVQLGRANGSAMLQIVDDGVGFEPSLQAAYGLGLRGMRERVDRLGGTFDIDSSPGHGTRVRIEVPR